MPDKIRPATKQAAMNEWTQSAYKLTATIAATTARVNEGIRRTIQDGRLKGQTERRLVKAVEELEDSVAALGVILLGPEPSQEELDEV